MIQRVQEMFFIFDLDGTLALISHRQHLVSNSNRQWPEFYKACVNDLPNKPVIATFKALVAAGHRVEIWSGRSDIVKCETEVWLEKQGISATYLKHMRPQKNSIPDNDLKLEWLKTEKIKPYAIFDDPDKVVKMWRENNIPCFQIATGNF